MGEDQTGIAASLLLLRFRQWIAGSALPMTGIGTVTVSPTHRQRGIAAALMSQALRSGRERGDLVSALYPFRVSFYQNLGYGQAGAVLQFQIAPQHLPSSDQRKYVELLNTDAARAEALALYNRWAQQQTGQLERDARAWKQLTDKDDIGLVGYRRADGALDGYALVSYRMDPPNRFLLAEEIIWLSRDARRGLYGWLASLSDQWKQIVVHALPSHRLEDWITEPRLPPGHTARRVGLWAAGATLMMGPMFRLLDLRNAWEQRRVQAAAPFSVAVTVTDEQIAENAGTWRLGFDLNRVSVETRSDADFALRTNISTLSRLYIGAISPAQALEAGLLECDRPELLSTLGAALAVPEPWTFDHF